jgi:hypothetical protein
MKQLTCFVGSLRPTAKAPRLPITVDGQDPASFLNAASAGSGAQPTLDLRLDYSRLQPAFVPPASDTLSMHMALRALTGFSTPGTVSNLGVILTDKFPPKPEVFGVMFDVGFDSDLGNSSSFNAVPREGCAVFLDPILAARGNGPAFDREVGFTLVHELGHVFNLWHHGQPLNFMSSSQLGAPFGPAAHFFKAMHANFLHLVDRSPFVAPGGSPWGIRGGLGPNGDNPANRPQTDHGLRLAISVRQHEFWSFEPAELDIKISARAAARIPDVIDPGYDEFDIWIETPIGTRHRYRPPTLFCRNPSKIKLGPKQPFARDISIFGQSGGYTFRYQGRHAIWATLRVGGRVLRSNRTEVVVKPPALHGEKFRRLFKVMTESTNARLLFYKSGPTTAAVTPLLDAAKVLGNTPNAANVRYSVGKALVRSGHGRGGADRRRKVDMADRVLKTALDSGQLSAHRSRCAAALLTELDTG